MSNDYLSHYGVLGMKWGVRRYQNKDGSLTAEGKARKQWGPAEANAKQNDTPVAPVAGGGIDEELDVNDAAELYNDTLEKIRKSQSYAETFKLVEDLNKLAEDRKKAFDASNVASVSVYDKRADNIVAKINERLAVLDNTFSKEAVQLRKTGYGFVKDWSPGKFMVSELSSYPGSFKNIKAEPNSGRVVKDFRQYAENDPKKQAFKAVHSSFLQQDYLCHYGIKGMKWGIRRYQNPDGSLTNEGIQRYGSKKGLKKYIRSEIKRQKDLADAGMRFQGAVDYASRKTAKTKEKYMKTGKTKHLSDYLAARDNESIQRAKLNISKKAMEDHYNKLVKEFGKENVSEISYKKGRLNEKGRDGERIVRSLIATGAMAGVTAGMIASGSSLIFVGGSVPRLASDQGEHAAKKDYKMLKKENRRIMKESGQAGKTEYNVQKRQQAINLANKTPEFATVVDDRKKKRY